MKVYLAGKIEKSDWRHDIFHGLRNFDENNRWNRDRLFADGFEYGGPYFISDDHGSYHGEGTHGRGVGLDEHEDGLMAGRPDRDKQVVDKCLKGVAYSDIVFCWIDSPDAYGTFIELGVAASLGKVIFLSIDKELVGRFTSDFWFAQTLANHVVYCDSATEAWGQFLKYSGVKPGNATSGMSTARPISKPQADLITGLLVKAKKELTISIHMVSRDYMGALIGVLRDGETWPDNLPNILVDAGPDDFIYKATEVVKMVGEALGQHGRDFTMYKHSACVREYGVKESTNEYCKQYPLGEWFLYSRLWVDFLITELSNEQTYNKLFPPKSKKSA